MATRSVTGLPDNDMDEATVSGHGPNEQHRRELAQSYAETFAALNAVMSKLKAKQADDPEGLAARLWDQR